MGLIDDSEDNTPKKQLLKKDLERESETELKERDKKMGRSRDKGSIKEQ